MKLSEDNKSAQAVSKEMNVGKAMGSGSDKKPTPASSTPATTTTYSSTSSLTSSASSSMATNFGSDEGVLERPHLDLPVPVSAKGDIAKAVDESGVVCRTHVGGQALIEGVMMRGRYNWALAVREPSGKIYMEEHDLISGRDKNSWMYKPVVRGCTALVESLALGYQALQIAAEHAFEDDDDDAATAAAADADVSAAVDANDDSTTVTINANDDAATADDNKDDVKKNSDTVVLSETQGSDSVAKAQTQALKLSSENEDVSSQQNENGTALPKAVMSISMILGILLGVGIFIVLPAVITNFLVGDYAKNTLLWNAVDGVLRVAIFIFYIWLIGRMPDIKRMFAYHGAEHKTIHCYEHGLELTVGNARRFPTLHVRCGTAFMIMTMIIAILVFTLVPVGPIIDQLGINNDILRLLLVIASRIILLPLVAGLSYEITVKWAGTRPENPLVRIILWPGLQMQRLTTNNPDDDMLECAIAAMQQVLHREELELAASSKN
ncbi:MAG: DUF1385 domain-containing protein [Coriobacteriales bacterium]|jgi:uncharacterized protein YqhQ|nr:DUF1385 domain-containing protein [Coriobacteriales bacterium]